VVPKANLVDHFNEDRDPRHWHCEKEDENYVVCHGAFVYIYKEVEVENEGKTALTYE